MFIKKVTQEAIHAMKQTQQEAMKQARQESSQRAARLRTILIHGAIESKALPDIQCDCGLYMYWKTEIEPRCPQHGAIYQPIQRKLIDPLLEENCENV